MQEKSLNGTCRLQRRNTIQNKSSSWKFWCIFITFQESSLHLYYHNNHTGYTTETTTSWLQTNQNSTSDYDSFQTSVTDVRCWKWFTETSQIITDTVTDQTHSCPYHYYWAVQWSWFARVNALCNLSRKKSWEVAASLPGCLLRRRCFTLYNGSWT